MYVGSQQAYSSQLFHFSFIVVCEVTVVFVGDADDRQMTRTKPRNLETDTKRLSPLVLGAV